MKSFIQTSSIARRAAVLSAVLILAFTVDLLVSVWANSAMLKGLQSLYETNQVLDHVAQAQESLDASIGALEGIGRSGAYDSSKQVFLASQRITRGTLRTMSEISGIEPDTRAYIQESARSIGNFENAVHVMLEIAENSSKSARPVRIRKQLVVISQFELETRESLRKLQIHVSEQAGVLFANVYATRNRPIYTMLALVLSLFLILLLLGLPLLQNIFRQLRGLMRATDVVSSGRLDYRAPVLRSDELGGVTFAFNRMVGRLEETQLETTRHAEVERLRLQFLSESTQEIARDLGYEGTLRRMSRAAVPYLADWCIVDMLDADGHVQRVAVEHSDETKKELLQRINEFAPATLEDKGVSVEVMRSGRAVVIPRVDDQWLQAHVRNSEHAKLLKDLGFVSGLTIPIRIRERVVGAITLVSADEERIYSEDDVLLAEDFARRSSYALVNANLYRDVQQAVRVRDEFLSIASHELKTPITPLKMQIENFVRILRKDGDIPHDRLERGLDTCVKMINRMIRLIDDLLDVSRINAGRLQLHYEDFDFTEVVREMLERFEREFKQGGCEISVALSESICGRWDRARIEQVIVNLFTNALRYGAGKPIEVSVSRDGAFVTFVVRDHGVGISPEDHHRIFKRFERASAENQYGGLGLGLYIVSQILDLHGGSIAVESALGIGSTFTVRVPVDSEK